MIHAKRSTGGSQARCLLGALIVASLPLAVYPTAPLHAAVIDAGSTGNRLHLFKWTPTSHGLPVVEDLASSATDCSNHQPLAQATSLSAVNDALQGLLTCAASLDKNLDLAVVPLTLMATAGMRVLPYRTQEQVMTWASAVLSRGTFLFDPSRVQVIPGSQEAYFGWVSANYLAHGFQITDPAQTLGMIDMGGSSLEIAYAVPTSVAGQIKGQPITQFAFPGSTLHVFATSFAEYGSDAFNQHRVTAAGLCNASPPTPDPCLLVNAMDTSVATCELHGAASYDQCRASVDSNLHTDCPTLSAAETCSLDNTPIPAIPSNLPFELHASYYWAFTDLDITSVTTDAMTTAAQDVCNKNVAQVLAKYPHLDAPNANWTCEHLLEELLVLEHGFDLSQHALNTSQAGWAIGAALVSFVLPSSDRVDHTCAKHKYDGGHVAAIAIACLSIGLLLSVFGTWYFLSKHRQQYKIEVQLQPDRNGDYIQLSEE
ncbi:uncharacterized protein MONBRDRAFT_23722 [Monosiga brevicollis MX1]|uniref:Uncharacterized protein n=1 Tax=Monosiga brevicollis TaxID=81824 RepID=A9UU92_MONBE|nr:uncharacterized protein MONBRDRAFT_23722 [Monosiga brevicollis MX1]EDQ91627.1 predicted protein [Monosiga brevicollis MX1]|eukprot:XP_001744049.1 hypothetical protein [Monosiga brevicollis MX1]